MTRLSTRDGHGIDEHDTIDAQAASWFARNRNEVGTQDR